MSPDAEEARDPSKVLLESEALRRNLQETAVRDLVIDPKYRVLQEVVEHYRGLRKTVDSLVFELNHPFRNWRVILPELRGFALKNFASYGSHPGGPKAVELILEVFLEALATARRAEIQHQAMESLLAYLEKVIQTPLDGGSPELPSVLGRCFVRLMGLPEAQCRMLARSPHPLKRIGKGLLARDMDGFDFDAFNRLLVQCLRMTYRDWLQEEDPLEWFRRQFGQDPPSRELGEALQAVSHPRLEECLSRLDLLPENGAGRPLTERLLELPGHLDIVRMYRELPDRLAALQGQSQEGPAETRDPLRDGKILFLFRIMETQALSEIHEQTLGEVQRSLILMIRSEPLERLESFLLKTFELLKQNVHHYPRTALQCIHSIGQEVFRKGQSRLVEIFLEQAVSFGFQPPCVTGVDTEWQWLSNPSHLMNIRIWLDIICMNPKWCTTLLSALIINLKLAGTCIRDTDLFQKDITKLLNSEVEPLYHLVKQLAKLIPTFFNEIGAEGLLRDISTDVDEILRRKDPLIHFLRKQSHVESSNLIVEFVEEILRFWITKDKEGLRRFLPQEVFDQVDPQGPYVEGPHRVLRGVGAFYPLDEIQGLLSVRDEQMVQWVGAVEGVPEEERQRVILTFRMYRLLYQKYYLGFQEIRYHLAQAKAHGFTGLDQLQEVLDRGETEECLEALLDYLDVLKGIILSPVAFEATEDIYHKRHIAADIPSVYGRYHERKFDALGLSLRLENLANVYFERLIDSVNLSLITRSTFFRIIRCIKLFLRAMQVDGISSQRLDVHIKLLEKALEVRRFTYTQYLDIMRGLSEGVKDILNVYYTDVHKDNLPLIIAQLGREHILPTYIGHAEEREEDDKALVDRVSERFLRDIIGSTFGLQYLDNFLTRIHQTLAMQKQTLSERELDLLMTYDPDKVTCPIHHPNRLTNDAIHLGSKGYNLVCLASEGIPVPPGFIITTEVFRCHTVVNDFFPAREDLLAQIRDQIAGLEEATGRTFGDPSNPLLVSVRSGATISMPGMMDTILNLGINEEIAEGLAAASGNRWFAYDNYRRFLQTWGMSFGMERDAFSEIMRNWKARYGVSKKREFTGEQMKEMALAYAAALQERRIQLYEDPWEQLEVAIQRVIYSWNAPKARDYREIMGISDDWGTAVIVQAMVYGNRGPESGSGVLFTANPQRRMRRVVLWGDFSPMVQGEDIVAGLVRTYPISNEQRELSGRQGEITLEDQFPDVYGSLEGLAKGLVYEKRWNPQEIEFTFEGPDRDSLYILQTRDMVTMRRSETVPAFVPSQELHESYLGNGIGVSGGALCGMAVFTLEEIRKWRGEAPDVPLILIRSDTVPDDIKEISLTDGLLTARGGQTSHAAIVALRLGKTCVVGCAGLVLLSDRGPCRIYNTEIRCGDFISIDGQEGSIYLGRHPVQQRTVRAQG
jgi:pyruvate,orthophosphate dikinase